MIKARLRNSQIEVYTETVNQLHLAVIKSLSVRKWNRQNKVWVVPLEAAPEVVERFSQLKDASVDHHIESIARRLNHLTHNKFNVTGRLPYNGELKTNPLKHQEQWLNWSSYFKACLNSSQQGTGKTKMALDWLSMRELTLGLVVCRNKNVYKWASEVPKHSYFKAFVLKGSRDERIKTLSQAVRYHDSKGPAIAIINYEYLQPFIMSLLSAEFQAVILDECTAIKNVRAKRHKAAMQLRDAVEFRLGLTGTPLVNSPADGFGQFKFINPGVFGEILEVFKRRYLILGGYGNYQVIGYKNMEEFKEKLDRFSFRVLKKDCLDLPPKVFQEAVIEPSSEWKKQYREIVEAELLEIGDKVIDNTLAVTRILRCLQFCDGFLYDTAEQGKVAKRVQSPKENELLEFLEDLFQSERKVIIWAYFRATIHHLVNIIKKRFPQAEVHGLMGGSSAIDSQRLIDSFNDAPIDDNKVRCMILQSTSFMHGIDIRDVETMIYYSRSWSNEEWLQTQDRIHGINRGGKKCTYISFMTHGTAEMSVHKALIRKVGVQAYLLGDVERFASFLKGVFHD